MLSSVEATPSAPMTGSTISWLIMTSSASIFTDYVGYTSWSDVLLSERGYCYRGYNAKTVLPEWHIEEEKYNK